MKVESSRGQRGRFRREGGSRLENTREREGGEMEREGKDGSVFREQETTE